MPLSKYNRWWGGQSGSAAKAKRAMMDHYGAEKGTSVFYATLRKRQQQGKGDGLSAALRRRRQQHQRQGRRA